VPPYSKTIASKMDLFFPAVWNPVLKSYCQKNKIKPTTIEIWDFFFTLLDKFKNIITINYRLKNFVKILLSKVFNRGEISILENFHMVLRHKTVIGLARPSP
jgi:hypothetical protein